MWPGMNTAGLHRLDDKTDSFVNNIQMAQNSNTTKINLASYRLELHVIVHLTGFNTLKYCAGYSVCYLLLFIARGTTFTL